VAAAAARAGIRSVVLVPADLEPPKILLTSVYGGTFITVDGTYDDVNRLASELAGEHEDWAFVNVNVRPYYAEGSKTLGFEIAEQLGWRLPEQVVVPIASGAQLVKVDKGFGELTSLGLVPEGIFGETAGGVTLAVLRKLLAAGQLDPGAETVIINSGDGLKTLDAITAVVDVPAPIRPTLESFQEAVS